MPGKAHPDRVQKAIHLPNDILAHIINKLAVSDTYPDRTSLAALASCRLTSHALRSLATPLFFSSIELRDPWATSYERAQPFEERATALKQILNINDIAASVQTLTLRSRKKHLEKLINGTLISEILHRVPRIRKFVLQSEEGSLDFSSISEDLASTILALGRSPDLKTLELSNIHLFPTTVITAYFNLRCLRLWQIGFCVNFIFSLLSAIIDSTSQFDLKNVNPMGQTSLDSLHINDGSVSSFHSGISGDISFATYFSRIKNLQLDNVLYNIQTLLSGWHIMLLASETLTTLDFLNHSESRFHL